ncbi:hypothetical protein OO013_16080 [Mangrovivirga sp. M17]|uniref:DUF4386 family protein n=1 Tax=Mangrovivirga halotolerans TaxID=2993936 RepID=A0ABT3RUU6_9BACT|nr:hypothetical protein [Mangrovivirga halotolerans]MCX2745398.1 hypothetical protein [Mangrovivirga halotolerans]
MKNLTHFKLGGLFLFLGSLILLITIYFEYQTGWIGVERTNQEVPVFMFGNWTVLEKIWGWQLFTHVFFVIAYIMFIKKANPFMSVIWSAMLIGSIMAIIGYGITLGSYYPALEVFDTQPALFNSIRGAVRILFGTGMTGMLLFIIPFCYESFTSEGAINKTFGIVTLAIIALSIILGMLTSLDIKITGVSWFFMPLILGISYSLKSAK